MWLYDQVSDDEVGDLERHAYQKLTRTGHELEAYHRLLHGYAEASDPHEYSFLLLRHVETILRAAMDKSTSHCSQLKCLSSGNAARCSTVYTTLVVAWQFQEIFRKSVMAGFQTCSNQLYTLLATMIKR